MNHQKNNLLQLINKYSVRFGEQDPLVLDLKKEVIELQLRQVSLSFLDVCFFERNVKGIEFEPTV
jgi:hypothetical protein